MSGSGASSFASRRDASRPPPAGRPGRSRGSGRDLEEEATDVASGNPLHRSLRTVALTGGTGFVGAFLIDEFLARGIDVRALARAPEKLSRWRGRIRVVEGGLGDEAALADLAAGSDVFVNCAGLTHALTAADFHETNVAGAVRAARAAKDAGAFFTHISSIAARRPALSPYAGSKAESETAVAAARSDGGWIALRAPAIYGPGDAATLPYFRMVRAGLAPEPATRPPARASILYAGDIAAAVVLAAIEAPAGAVYEIGDEAADGHTWGEIGAALGRAFGKKPFRLRAPKGPLLVQAALAEAAARLRGRPTFVTRGKVAEFFHPDWAARDNLLSRATSWRPTTPLDEGFAKTLKWYQEEGLL